LTFTAEEDGSTFGIVNNAGNNPDLQYSLDGGKTWTALAGGDSVLLAHKGDKALLKGDNPQGFSKSFYQPTFKMTGKVAASGSVMSLICGTGLSAEILGNSCFVNLFKDCTSLTQAPELPATILTESCYDGMFSGCTSLTQAPELPATTLDYVCYANMFNGCTGLTQAPKLPATTLLEGCYWEMFSGCTSLSEINVSFEDWDYGMGTGLWVANVAPTGTFICPKALPLEYGDGRIPEGWTVKYIDDTVAAETNYLTFTAEEDGSTFGIVNNGKNNPDIQYSLDGGKTWTALAAGDTVTLSHKGDKALLRGDNPEGFSKEAYSKYSSFTMTGKIAASGSVMSLIDGMGKTLVVPAAACFCELFSGCTSLTQAPELPAMTLADYCYSSMFYGCTSLTEAPELPAMTLANSCYSSMFSGCTSLTQAPELPVMTLEGLCYESMFKGCTSLTQAPELPATTLVEGCYRSMFSGCTSLTEAPELPAMTLTECCYRSMFSGCTSLTQAPELPATKLDAACYRDMFSGCASLSEINVSFEDWDYGMGTGLWVANVAPTGTFICPKALALEYGEDRIPEGWTVKYVDEGSGVSSALADGVTVWTDDLTIFVRGAEGEVSLYDMTGRIVATSNSKDEERALCVPSKGVYVVRTSGGERSVLVR
ncbi:MAG: leucine-rich repeat protein, partial [Prevotella sp.]|nr:leucine-rich repeat protein [Prevotella sp.]